MMDISFLLNPLSDSIYAEITHNRSFFKNISCYKEKIPELSDADIAIIGVEVAKGDSKSADSENAADAIRHKLYRLMKGSGAYKIVDLGNIGQAIDVDQTYDRLRVVCEHLMEQNILPIIIGSSHELSFPQYLAYENMDKLVSVLNVDAFLDMNDQSTEANEKHLHKILTYQPNYLFNYSHLAYQQYLIDPESIAFLEKLYFEAYRVGSLRHDIKEMEPIIRQADMMTFDLAAIRSSDAPASAKAQAFGLTGEEACQLAWYAGLNEKLSSVGFYEYNPKLDDASKKTASVVATMIWYFIEGFYHRKDSKDFRSNDYLKYVVSMDNTPEAIVFYKSKISEKWWMEVPFPQGRTRFGRNCIVPCSYSDYEMANRSEVPERWVNAQIKLV